MVDLKLLIANGVQFGHQTWRWSPLMAPYIWGEKNGVHLIDVSKTAMQLDRAARFLESVTAEGKQVLWVGTKKAAQGVIKETAEHLKCPYAVNRWIGGTLTNFPQVKKSVTKLLHFEDVVEKTDKYSYTKKEFGTFKKVVDRLEKNVGGIRTLNWPVGALVVVDAKKEATAIREAASMGVPIVALVDTIGWPNDVVIDYLVPGNDDAARAISVIVKELSAAVERGMEVARTKKVEADTAQEIAAYEAGKATSADLVLGEEGEEEKKKRPARAPRSAAPAAAEAPAPRAAAAARGTAGKKDEHKPATARAAAPRRRPLAPKKTETKETKKPAEDKKAS